MVAGLPADSHSPVVVAHSHEVAADHIHGVPDNQVVAHNQEEVEDYVLEQSCQAVEQSYPVVGQVEVVHEVVVGHAVACHRVVGCHAVVGCPVAAAMGCPVAGAMSC